MKEAENPNTQPSSMRGLLFCLGIGMTLTMYTAAVFLGILLICIATFIPFPLWFFPNPPAEPREEITEVEIQDGKIVNVKK